jgi:hypothetical protein
MEFASMLLQQPAAAAPALSAARPPATPSRPSNVGLASVPNMFGDCPCGTIANVTIGNGTIESQFRVPIAGGARTSKMAENDISLPVDRIFFGYNHFHNTFQMESQETFPVAGPLLTRQEPIDRYTMGVEKTFFDQLMSIELRMPFSGSFDAGLPGLTVSNGNIGNLGVIWKMLLWQGDNLGIGAGLGIDTPTGSGTFANTSGANLRFQNDALHLLPWIGFLYAPGDPYWGWGDTWFMSGFMQFDAACNGNRVQFIDPISGTTDTIGRYNEQNVMFFDIAIGYWLYRDPYAERLTGVSVVNEFHYTTSVQDSDLVAGVAADGTGAVITNERNSIDVMNYSIGLQFLLFDMSSLRVAGVFPLGSDPERRFFDSEVQVQFNRKF